MRGIAGRAHCALHGQRLRCESLFQFDHIHLIKRSPAQPSARVSWTFSCVRCTILPTCNLSGFCALLQSFPIRLASNQPLYAMQYNQPSLLQRRFNSEKSQRGNSRGLLYSIAYRKN
jgi:phospholipid N-methyltransferase